MSDCLFLKQDNTVKTIVERSKEKINSEDVAVLYIQNTGKKGKRKFIWGPLLKSEENQANKSSALKMDDGTTTQENVNTDRISNVPTALKSASNVQPINVSSNTTQNTSEVIQASLPIDAQNGLSSSESAQALQLMKNLQPTNNHKSETIKSRSLDAENHIHNEIMKCHLCEFKPKSQ